jgi:hypothetical protein
MLADALGLNVPNSAEIALLQQAPEAKDETVAIPMEDYKFHSTGIIETLEKLAASFTETKKSGRC